MSDDEPDFVAEPYLGRWCVRHTVTNARWLLLGQAAAEQAASAANTDPTVLRDFTNI